MSTPLATRPQGGVPSTEQLTNHALRQIAGAALIVVSVAVVHHAGAAQQKWQYVAMAAALGPEALLSLLALADRRRRNGLRTARRPHFVLLGASAVLATMAVVSWLSRGFDATVAAALIAAGGLFIASAPVGIRVAPGMRGRAAR